KAAQAYELALSGLATGVISDSSGHVIQLAALRSDEAEAVLAQATKLWNGYKQKLTPVLNFAGSPYPAENAQPAATEANAAPKPTGTQYSPRGRRLLAAVKELDQYGAASHAQLVKAMADLAALVEGETASDSRTLKNLQI